LTNGTNNNITTWQKDPPEPVTCQLVLAAERVFVLRARSIIVTQLLEKK